MINIIKEIKEETGIDVERNQDNVISHKDILALGEPIMPSPGGCDEGIQLFFLRKTMTTAQIRTILDKEHGEANEHEHIILHLHPEQRVAEFIMKIGDVKAECAYNRICLLRQNGRL